MPLELQVIIAFILDQIVGDPHFLPHPIQGIGFLAEKTEVTCRGVWQNQRLAGIVTVGLVLAFVGLLVFGFIWLVRGVSWLPEIVEIYFLYSAIAARDLARHSQRVYSALQSDTLQQARLEVAKIVGRDTTNLDEAGVARACVESVAENLVDGVTAPLFWAVIAGPIGAICYKAINTMDSMFGYKNEKYLQFGWAAAHLDDLVNYIPARLTAFIIMAAAAILRLIPQGHKFRLSRQTARLSFNMGQSYRIWVRDRFNHASPNSGQSEAAVAGALGVQFGGPSVYFGKLIQKPTIGDAGQMISAAHIILANRLMLLSSTLALFLFVSLRIIFWNFSAL